MVFVPLFCSFPVKTFNKTVERFNISVNLKDTKKVDHILESSLGVLFRCTLLSFINKEIEDDIKVVSQFPCLLGHPV